MSAPKTLLLAFSFLLVLAQPSEAVTIWNYSDTLNSDFSGFVTFDETHTDFTSGTLDFGGPAVSDWRLEYLSTSSLSLGPEDGGTPPVLLLATPNVDPDLAGLAFVSWKAGAQPETERVLRPIRLSSDGGR